MYEIETEGFRLRVQHRLLVPVLAEGLNGVCDRKPALDV
jgi:hypothetical protein